MKKIRKLLEGVHMGLGHAGLRKLVKKELGVDIQELDAGDLVMCMNTYGDKMKLFGCKGLVIGYLKMPGQQRIMKEALQFIPETFGGTGFDYDKAVEKALRLRLAKLPTVIRRKPTWLDALSRTMPETSRPL